MYIICRVLSTLLKITSSHRGRVNGWLWWLRADLELCLPVIQSVLYFFSPFWGGKSFQLPALPASPHHTLALRCIFLSCTAVFSRNCNWDFGRCQPPGKRRTMRHCECYFLKVLGSSLSSFLRNRHVATHYTRDPRLVYHPRSVFLISPPHTPRLATVCVIATVKQAPLSPREVWLKYESEPTQSPGNACCFFLLFFFVAPCLSLQGTKAGNKSAKSPPLCCQRKMSSQDTKGKEGNVINSSIYFIKQVSCLCLIWHCLCSNCVFDWGKEIFI